MNATHVHLMLNHVPVLGTMFGLAVLLFGLMRKSDEIKKLAFGMIVITALFAVPVYLTGEPAEHAVEGLPGVSHAIVESHEEAAAVAFTAVVVIGIMALIGLIWRRNRPVPGWFASVMLLGIAVVAGLMAWTANLGGEVRHTEIRSGANAGADTADDD